MGRSVVTAWLASSVSWKSTSTDVLAADERGFQGAAEVKASEPGREGLCEAGRPPGGKDRDLLLPPLSLPPLLLVQ